MKISYPKRVMGMAPLVCSTSWIFSGENPFLPSNSFMAWQALGSPQNPTSNQIHLMELPSKLAPATGPTKVEFGSGNTEITFKLARQGVTLVELEWP